MFYCIHRKFHPGVHIPLSVPLSEDKINRIAYRNTLQNNNLQSLLQKTAAIPPGDAAAEEQLTLQVRALAYLAPDNCSRLAALLKKSPGASKTAYQVYHRQPEFQG